MAQRGDSVTSTDGTVPALTPVLERRLTFARAALFWEAFWPGLMPAGYVLALLLILAGFDVWRFLPIWLHWLMLAGFGCGFIGALWYGLRGIRWPGRGAAMRRLEKINLLQHRPLEAAADTLPAEQHDPIARAIWALHRRRALEKLSAVRVGLPEAGWWRRDVWGFRVALGLLLVIAWASPGEDRVQRLTDTVNPGTVLPHGTTLMLEAWITPPPYTGKAPVFLSRDGKPVMSADALAIPAGSELKLRLAAPPGGFSLRFGAKEQDLKAIDERNGELDVTLDLTQGEAPQLALLRRDKPFAEWRLQMVPDQPPVIDLAEAPKAAKRNELEIGFEATDDYGVQQVRIELRREEAEQPVMVDWPAPPAAPG